MENALDAVLEILSWIGFGGAVLLGIALMIAWAADGTWLPADAIVDRDGPEPVVRWFDADGEANAAVPSHHEAAELADRDAARVWYRHGWSGRMRLTARHPAVRALGWGAASLFALGVVTAATSWILLFVRG